MLFGFFAFVVFFGFFATYWVLLPTFAQSSTPLAHFYYNIIILFVHIFRILLILSLIWFLFANFGNFLLFLLFILADFCNFAIFIHYFLLFWEFFALQSSFSPPPLSRQN